MIFVKKIYFTVQHTNLKTGDVVEAPLITIDRRLQGITMCKIFRATFYYESHFVQKVAYRKLFCLQTSKPEI